ncbi:hypothetical protein ILUMI_12662 [Ignelater luminosus]|uniref:Uncharacterized protein n=1 Tax=Ignelater luminosus TaxID=2038154 RepID=A0A8K0CXQ4_IGNLU|nr:hypothetical protein ILUMI_12662 [Ignelater luminosus]
MVPKIIAATGIKEVEQAVSAERSKLVTFCAITNAVENTMPPVYVFPPSRFKDVFLKESPHVAIATNSMPSARQGGTQSVQESEDISNGVISIQTKTKRMNKQQTSSTSSCDHGKGFVYSTVVDIDLIDFEQILFKLPKPYLATTLLSKRTSEQLQKRYESSGRGTAKPTSALLLDVGIINEADSSKLIHGTKIMRERRKSRGRDNDKKPDTLNVLYFDGRKLM